jgi:hypothetical protein
VPRADSVRLTGTLRRPLLATYNCFHSLLNPFPTSSSSTSALFSFISLISTRAASGECEDGDGHSAASLRVNFRRKSVVISLFRFIKVRFSVVPFFPGSSLFSARARRLTQLSVLTCARPAASPFRAFLMSPRPFAILFRPCLRVKNALQIHRLLTHLLPPSSLCQRSLRRLR